MVATYICGIFGWFDWMLLTLGVVGVFVTYTSCLIKMLTFFTTKHRTPPRYPHFAPFYNKSPKRNPWHLRPFPRPTRPRSHLPTTEPPGQHGRRFPYPPVLPNQLSRQDTDNPVSRRFITATGKLHRYIGTDPRPWPCPRRMRRRRLNTTGIDLPASARVREMPSMCMTWYNVGTLHVRVDRSKMLSHGKPSPGRLLLRSHVWGCTVDIKAWRELSEPLSTVDGPFEAWRQAAVAAWSNESSSLVQSEPESKIVQPNTIVEGDGRVVLKLYDASDEGIIQSFVDRDI